MAEFCTQKTATSIHAGWFGREHWIVCCVCCTLASGSCACFSCCCSCCAHVCVELCQRLRSYSTVIHQHKGNLRACVSVETTDLVQQTPQTNESERAAPKQALLPACLIQQCACGSCCLLCASCATTLPASLLRRDLLNPSLRNFPRSTHTSCSRQALPATQPSGYTTSQARSCPPP